MFRTWMKSKVFPSAVSGFQFVMFFSIVCVTVPPLAGVPELAVFADPETFPKNPAPLDTLVPPPPQAAAAKPRADTSAPRTNHLRVRRTSPSSLPRAGPGASRTATARSVQAHDRKYGTESEPVSGGTVMR